MRSNNVIVDTVAVPELNLYPSTQGWEHLCKDHLLIPHGLVTALLHAGLALKIYILLEKWIDDLSERNLVGVFR